MSAKNVKQIADTNEITEFTGKALFYVGDDVDGTPVDAAISFDNMAALVAAKVGIVTKGADFDVTAAEAGKLYVVDDDAPVTVTLLDEADGDYVPGMTWLFVQIDEPVSFASDDLAVIVSKDSNVDTNGIGTGCSLTYLGNETWWLAGDLA
jgi:hypothetical protein